jgi:hypothetical protein
MVRRIDSPSSRDSNAQKELDGVSFGAMAGPAATQIMRRKRGNPNWGRPMPPAPVLATEFERQVRTLRLTPETYVFSAKLRRWCWQNRNRFYIPEWLLEKWRIAVDAYTSNAAPRTSNRHSQPGQKSAHGFASRAVSAQNLNCTSNCMRRGGRAATACPKNGEVTIPM